MINSLYPRMYNISSLFDDMDTYTGDNAFNSNSSDEYLRSSTSADYYHQHQHQQGQGQGQGGTDTHNNSTDSIDVSEEYLNNSTGSVSFNNLLGRSAVGLQLAHPNTLNSPANSAMLAAAGVKPEFSTTPQSAQQLALFTSKLLNTVAPTAEVFEGDQIYLLDDRSNFYMYVGRAVPAGAIEEIMLTTPGKYLNLVSFSIFVVVIIAAVAVVWLCT